VKLRQRLALVTVAVTLPMIGLLVWLDARARQDAAEDELADLTLALLSRPGERERCETMPETWGMDFGPRGRPPGAPPGPPPGALPGPPPGPPPGAPRVRGPRHRLPPRFFVYDESLRSPDPLAPALAGAAPDGRGVVSRSSTLDEMHIEILVPTPWATGPCAYVLARGTKEPWLGALLPDTRIWLVPMLVVFVAVLVAIGPAIRRLRRLTEAVRRTAQAGYEAPVRVDGRDEVAELARAFDAASREVRAQLAEKDRREQALRHFLADTTHDVMIPLTVLQGHLANLRDRLAAGERLEPALVGSAMDEAHYIGALLHNLGAVAKLDASAAHVPIAPVDLNALVTRVVGRHRPIARQREVTVESALPDETIVAQADVTLLEQAVSNVVYNAVRHNRPGGHVAVILETEGPARFRLRVVDDGPGIPAEELARLAERGYRGSEARSRTPDGQGLGLHIVHRVARLFGLELVLGPSEYGGLQVDLAGPRTPGAPGAVSPGQPAPGGA
jgi:signal transduction histidine kinase